VIKKIIAILFIALCSLTCNSHSSTVFLENKYKMLYVNELCNPKKEFPQLIAIPYFEEASQLVPNCQTYPVHKTAFAMFIFYHQWLEYFYDHDSAVKDMLQRVMIQWSTKKRIGKRGFNINGEPFRNHKILGVVISENIIWVWQGYHHRISESALIHELVHLALRAKNGHADADHEGSKYAGWTPLHTNMISETKQMLRAFEL